MRHISQFLLVIAVSVPAFAKVDSGLLALVPSNAKIITGVDVSRAKTSPFGQYMLNKINTEDDDFQQMMQETGFDPRRDVQDFLFCSSRVSGESADSSFALMVRGSFDQARIKKTLLSKGAKVQTYQDVEMLVDASNHGRTAFAFPDVDIAVMGDLGTVQQIISNRANPTALDPALQQQVSNAGGSHDAWFASSAAGSFLADNLTRQAGPRVQPEALQSITQSSGGITFGDTVQLSFDAVTRTPKDANSLVDVVRFLTSMVQMQRQSDPRAAIMASSFDQMTLVSDGDNVHVAMSVPERNLEQLAELKPRQRVSKAIKPARQ